MHPAYATPLTAAPPDVDREAVAAAGADVTALLAGAPVSTDDRTLAVAATGALAARLPALSGTDDAAALGEIEDDLLHAYAELLASRATTRPGADRDDLLAVAHLAAAAASEDAANDPALLLLADVPAARQVAAAVVLLAQTADDGGGAPDRLAAEVRGLFRPAG